MIPAAIAPVVERHLGQVSAADDDKLLFTSPEGMPLRHSNFRRRFWLPALQAAGLPLIHFHDLRHTGNMLAAGTGAGLRELMDRMGHSTLRASWSAVVRIDRTRIGHESPGMHYEDRSLGRWRTS